MKKWNWNKPMTWKGLIMLDVIGSVIGLAITFGWMYLMPFLCKNHDKRKEVKKEEPAE